MELLSKDEFQRRLGLTSAGMSSFMDRNPPRYDIEGALFFKFDDEMLAFLDRTYKKGPEYVAGA